MRKKLLYMEDLVEFFKASNLTKFSSSESGYKLCVQVPSTFEVEEKDDDSDHRGMMRLKIRIFHLYDNRNGSFVSEKAAKDAMPTIKNRPIMAYIHQRDDGEWDFETHNMTVETDEDGNDYIEYQEKQIGSFDESKPFFEYDKELDKTYVCAYAYISEDYTRACDIIRRKGGTKNSCELTIEELAYNQKEKLLELQKFYVSASTLLGSLDDGTEVEEGMLGSRADIVDFSAQNNSVVFNQNNKLIETLDKLNDTLARFNINPAQSGELKEGGKLILNKFEELLKKYNKTADEIEFEYKDLTDEELEAKFSEVFDTQDPTSEQFDGEDAGDEGGETGEEDHSQDDDNNDTDPEPTEDDVSAAAAVSEAIEALTDESGLDEVQAACDAYDDLTDVQKELISDEDLELLRSQESRAANIRSEDEVGSGRQNNSLEYSVTFNGVTRTNFATLSEQLNALWTLVNETYGELDNEWYTVDADAEKKLVYMHGWAKHYRQSYKVKNDTYSLVGDRVEIFEVFLSADEKKELENLRSNYSLIENELNEYKEKELHSKREAICAVEEYSILKDNSDFIALKEHMDDYTPDDLSEKADLIYAKYMKTFANNTKPEKKSGVVFMASNFNDETSKKEPYGGIFKDYFKNKKNK